VSNDFSGKPMAAIEGITVWHGPPSHIEFQLFVKLTMPSNIIVLMGNEVDERVQLLTRLQDMFGDFES
jgi:hypothetical protein